MKFVNFVPQGATIKRIMEETCTKITVSSINEITAFNQERVITIRGDTVEDMSRAEAEISSKLRAAYEGDVMAVSHSQTFHCIPRYFFNESNLHMTKAGFF